MKKITLLFIMGLFSANIFAVDPPKMDITTILNFEPSLGFEIDTKVSWDESAIKGCVGDFNNDGIDDFILTGLWASEGVWNSDASLSTLVQKSFIQVYLGQSVGKPVLAYEDRDFGVAGNGGVDCSKLADGSWLVAVQGGANGNWDNDFTAKTYLLKADGNTVDFRQSFGLDTGAGRGTILVLDINNDKVPDIYQHGWKGNQLWDAQSNIYLNEGASDWFEYTRSYDIRPSSNTTAVKGDLNNDGLLDIVIPINGVGLFAYLNKGTGEFQEILLANFSGAERADGRWLRGEDDLVQCELIDFNNDGYLDVALIGTWDNDVNETVDPKITKGWRFVTILYENKKDGTFEELDWLASKNTDGELLNNEDNAFGQKISYYTGGQRGDLAVADFNLDGNMDIIIAAENQGLMNDGTSFLWNNRSYILLGDGKGQFDQFEVTRYDDSNPNGIEPMCRRGNYGRMLVGDFNGDKKPDLITAGSRFSDRTNTQEEQYAPRRTELRYHFNVSQGGAGISDITESNVAIYYAEKSLFVNNAENTIISLYNISGQKIFETQIMGAQETISLNLPAGIYIVKAQDKAQKIIIK